jgi:hypothetical protein
MSMDLSDKYVQRESVRSSSMDIRAQLVDVAFFRQKTGKLPETGTRVVARWCDKNKNTRVETVNDALTIGLLPIDPEHNEYVGRVIGVEHGSSPSVAVELWVAEQLE